MEVHVDTDRCIAAGNCVVAAPDVFDQRDEDGLAVVLDAHPPAGLQDAVTQAVALCPAGAIGARA